MGAKHGLQFESLSLNEKRVLRIFASQKTASTLRVIEAEGLGSFDAIPDAVAVKVAIDLVNSMRDLTTKELE